MTLSRKQQVRLKSIIKQAELILREAQATETKRAPSRSRGRQSNAPVRPSGRRSRADATAMRKEILAARKKGSRVAELAEMYGVTPSYIYQMR